MREQMLCILCDKIKWVNVTAIVLDKDEYKLEGCCPKCGSQLIRIFKHPESPQQENNKAS
jgi:hypothetical protein